MISGYFLGLNPMSPAIAMDKTEVVHDEKAENYDEKQERISQVLLKYQKGVKHLYESGITNIPDKYILPVDERPNNIKYDEAITINSKVEDNLKLPVIDFSELMQSSKRPQVLKSLENACQQYGFFQVLYFVLNRCDLDPFSSFLYLLHFVFEFRDLKMIN